MGSREFLNLVLMHLRKERPKASEALNYSIFADHNISEVFRHSTDVAVGFRTQGCRYNHNGGCTMCDYWISDPVPPEQMVVSIKTALDELCFEPHRLLLNVSGSFFDEWEVPQNARQQILRLFSVFSNTHFVFETHASTVSEEKILECINILKHQRFSIEMGLESANPWILKYCVNKSLALEQILSALTILKKHKIQSIVNIMIGLPFLSASEMISDAVSSVNWAFSQGIDKCVLFPMNIKPWNLVFWMEKQELYQCPPLWALIEVLSKLDAQFLPKIGLAWYRTRPQSHPGYKIPNRGPQTCPHCYNQVIELLDRFVISSERKNIVTQLVDLKCDCKKKWYAQKARESDLPLHKRLKAAYRVIGKQVLGEKWWSENGESVLNSVVPFQNLLCNNII